MLRANRRDGLKRLTRPLPVGVFLLAVTPFSIALGLWLGRFPLPVVQAVFAFPVFCALLIHSSWKRTVVVMVAWAAITGLLMILLSHQMGALLGSRILLGESYRDEMLAWIRTGVGAEGDPTRFLPQHLFHFLVFALLVTLSVGFLGLVMGAALMNYMSFYVGQLAALSADPVATALLAWPPWAALRVIAYILMATALSGLTLGHLGLTAPMRREGIQCLFLGAVLLLVDVLLKWWLAPIWRLWLGSLVSP